MVITEALLTRTGWKLPGFSRKGRALFPREIRRRKSARLAPAKDTIAASPSRPTAAPTATPDPSEQEALRKSRFQRAKDRKRDVLGRPPGRA